MKTLFIVRHAKSGWGDSSLPDKARPLTDRGERDAPMMGRRLAARGVKPDLIVSSPALRARRTADAMARTLDCDPREIVVNDRIYASEADVLIEVIHQLDDKLGCVMLVGHNPGLTALAHRFSDEINHMPTCAVAQFAFDTMSWSDVGAVVPSSVAFDYPKKT